MKAAFDKYAALDAEEDEIPDSILENGTMALCDDLGIDAEVWPEKQFSKVFFNFEIG